MTHLAEKIDQFFNEVILKAENQHEILIGSCTSDVPLTNTQEHILMLLSEESLTNSDLAKKLNVSQAAVTKAVKSLVRQEMLQAFKDKRDARVTFYRLTDLAQRLQGTSASSRTYFGDVSQKLAEQFLLVNRRQFRSSWKLGGRDW